MKKSLIIITVALLSVSIVVITHVYIIRNTFLKGLAERRIEHITGLNATLGKVETGIRNTDIAISNTIIRNPKGFKDPVMLDMPYLYADYNLSAIIHGRIHLYSMKIDIKEFSIIRNADNTLNLDSLKSIQEIACNPDAKKPKKPGLIDFKIDELDLNIDRVYYKDYSSGLMPYIRQYDLDINERFSDITSPDAVVHLIVLKALKGSGLSSILTLDINGMKNSIGDTLYTARKLARKTVRTVLTLPFGTAKTQE
jgi:hypothetical protein